MFDKRTRTLTAIRSAAVFAAVFANPAVADTGDNPFTRVESASTRIILAQGRCGMERMDRDGDGNVTKEEFRQGHEAVFSRTDSNGDGVLDADERRAHREMMRQRKGRCGAGKCGNSGSGK